MTHSDYRILKDNYKSFSSCEKFAVVAAFIQKTEKEICELKQLCLSNERIKKIEADISSIKTAMKELEQFVVNMNELILAAREDAH
jgi:cob(I)alamin adenosyltransferase